jgi:hypothetical protein
MLTAVVVSLKGGVVGREAAGDCAQCITGADRSRREVRISVCVITVAESGVAVWATWRSTLPCSQRCANKPSSSVPPLPVSSLTPLTPGVTDDWLSHYEQYDGAPILAALHRSAHFFQRVLCAFALSDAHFLLAQYMHHASESLFKLVP